MKRTPRHGDAPAGGHEDGKEGWQDMTKTNRRSGGLVVLAAAAIGLAACGGGGDTGAPHVASVGTSTTTAGTNGGSGSGSTTTALTGGNATQLMDEWAACMRTHGDPNQTDPTIDAHGVINIAMRDVSAAVSAEVHGNSGPCSQYELAAENALRGGQSAPAGPSQAAGAVHRLHADPRGSELPRPRT